MAAAAASCAGAVSRLAVDGEPSTKPPTQRGRGVFGSCAVGGKAGGDMTRPGTSCGFGLSCRAPIRLGRRDTGSAAPVPTRTGNPIDVFLGACRSGRALAPRDRPCFDASPLTPTGAETGRVKHLTARVGPLTIGWPSIDARVSAVTPNRRKRLAPANVRFAQINPAPCPLVAAQLASCPPRSPPGNHSPPRERPLPPRRPDALRNRCPPPANPPQRRFSPEARPIPGRTSR